LVPFASTHFCEFVFSNYTGTREKYRNRLNLEPDVGINFPISGQAQKGFVIKKDKTLFALRMQTYAIRFKLHSLHR
jgi:hypothetical protein